MTNKIRAAALCNYVELAQILGINPRTQLAEVGLDLALLNQDDARISAEAAARLLENSAIASGCSNFGLRLAESRQLSDFGAVSLSLLHQPTLRDALQITMHYRHLLNEALVMYIEDADEFVLIREEVVTSMAEPSRQAIEMAIGVLHRLCSALLGSHWHPTSINFTHSAPEDVGLHRRLFNCPVIFNAEFNGIVCPATDLAYPNANADPAMAKYAENYIASLPTPDNDTFPDEVRQAVYILLPMGRATIEQISQSLGVNTRTLQRRLDDNGLTFSDVINDVRRSLVVRYLDNPNFSLAAIADMLGYSVASSFTRWFTTQFGSSPVRWRAEHCHSYNEQTKNLAAAKKARKLNTFAQPHCS